MRRVFPLYQFPPRHRGRRIPDTSAGTRVGFPEHPALHGTWFLQTAEVSAALPRLACQWHRASKAWAAATLPVARPSGPLAGRAGVNPGAACQSLTLLLFMPGAGRREAVVCVGEAAASRHSPSFHSWKAASWFLHGAKESHLF